MALGMKMKEEIELESSKTSWEECKPWEEDIPWPLVEGEKEEEVGEEDTPLQVEMEDTGQMDEGDSLEEEVVVVEDKQEEGEHILLEVIPQMMTGMPDTILEVLQEAKEVDTSLN